MSTILDKSQVSVMSALIDHVLRLFKMVVVRRINSGLILQQNGERQWTTALANQTTGLTSGLATNWAPEVAFSPFRVISRRQMTFPFCC